MGSTSTPMGFLAKHEGKSKDQLLQLHKDLSTQFEKKQAEFAQRSPTDPGVVDSDFSGLHGELSAVNRLLARQGVAVSIKSW